MAYKSFFLLLKTKILYGPRLANLGRRTWIQSGCRIVGGEHISIGSSSIIRWGARLETIRVPDEPSPSLIIGSNVNIEQGVHLICSTNLTIEDNVSITPYCVIVDTSHDFKNPDSLPKMGALRDAARSGNVTIGAGTFVGAHSIILPGVKIGKGCVIAAGSVVTSSIPDYSTAQGVPARIKSTFDFSTRTWTPV